MNDKPYDLGKKSDSSNTESGFSPEKEQENDKDLSSTPNRSVSYNEKVFANSGQNRESLVQPGNMEFRLSMKTSRRHSPRESRDEIPVSLATSLGNMSDNIAENSTERQKSLNSTLGTMKKRKRKQSIELIMKSPNEKASEKCISPKPSPSINASSSFNDLDVQEYFKIIRINSYKKFKCQHCNRWFVHEKNLQIHSLLHRTERSFLCDVCGKTFCRSDDLNKHKNIHKEPKLFKCSRCRKDSERKRAL